MYRGRVSTSYLMNVGGRGGKREGEGWKRQAWLATPSSGVSFFVFSSPRPIYASTVITRLGQRECLRRRHVWTWKGCLPEKFVEGSRRNGSINDRPTKGQGRLNGLVNGCFVLDFRIPRLRSRRNNRRIREK